MTTTRFLAALALASTSLLPLCAGAQDSDAAAQAQARERFARALELFDEERYEEALIEFSAAYEQVSDYRVLYNIGNVHAELGHPVEAVDAWERYLTEGGDALDEARRAEVQGSLERQRSRIGTLLVRTNVDGATVTVDGVAVAQAPLEGPLRLAIGAYAIGVQAAGYEAPTRRVTVAGQSEQTLELTLERTSREVGGARIVSGVSDVEVRVDGETVGTTPMNETIPLAPGRHVVEASRPGYARVRRTIDVEHGQESTVELVLTIDPDAPPDQLGRVRLQLPAAPYRVRVDGSELAFSGGAAELPVGRHVIVLEVDQREPVREQIEVSAEAPLTMDVDLRWTPDARQMRLDGAGSQRLYGTLIAVAGGAIAAASVGFLIYNETRAERLAELEASYRACMPGSTTPTGCDFMMENEAEEYVALTGAIDTTRWLAGGGTAVGAVVLGVGLGLVFAAPSDEDIDRAADTEGLAVVPLIGPGSVGLRGRF